MTFCDHVASTKEPAFGVDSSAEIVAWNAGAEHLFGYAESEVLGRRCWEVLSGCDVFGNQYCSEECPLIGMVQQHRAISRCELHFRTAANRSIRVGVSTMAFDVGNGSQFTIVHLFTPLECEPAQRTAEPLTAREIAVLRLLADGKQTLGIGKLLNISEATVRNHIQQILHKLNVHTRLEAVCMAWRVGLIDNANHDAV
ncbi:MAG: LuxR C-terminal-related transcriptional regulator [Gammaproteobacteria bacterium]|nr:LuxR C-terminal-related transcriptional regulator [Gammaproteobacteria bacterium]MDH3379844.1 LuxR C-terminal-related transcriptional regulator [Gammaproteobacteria bacterium]